MSARRNRRDTRRHRRVEASEYPTASRARGSSRADLACGGALLAITVLAYLPALRNGFIWDDNHYVTENLVLRSFDGLQRLWLQPQSMPQYYPEARNNLGIALRQAGRLDEAIAQFEEAVRLQPSYAQARNNLRAALTARDQAKSARP